MLLATMTTAPQSVTVASPTSGGHASQLGASLGPLASAAVDPNINPFFWFAAMGAQQDQVVARAIERVQQDQQTLEQEMAKDIRTIEATNAGIQAG